MTSRGARRAMGRTAPFCRKWPNSATTVWPGNRRAEGSVAATKPATATVSSGRSADRAGSRYQPVVSDDVPGAVALPRTGAGGRGRTAGVLSNR